MRRTARNVLSLFIVLAFAMSVLPIGSTPTAQASSEGVVISQVYGGGGNSGATYKNDFIELFNRGNTAISVTGWSVQYASSAGTSWTSTELSGTIQPGKYFLIQQAAGAGGTVDLPTPDATGNIAMGGSGGKVALVNNNTALSGACPTGVVDFVGFGTSANCSETSPTPNTSNTMAAIRAGNGCTETDNNSADFIIAAPTPRNSASPINDCTVPLLSINDVSIEEGDSGTTPFVFTVSLSMPAGTGGVTFDIATADGTATVADNDYTAKSLTGQTIMENESSYTFSVLVNGDTVNESNEQFFVNVSNVSGATAADLQGVGTVKDDDTEYCEQPFTPIYAIQGTGTTVAVPGTVTTQGVVVGDFETGASASGFYLQDILGDADASTSDGIFVYTGNSDLVSAGQVVRVTGYARERFTQTTLNGSNSNSAAVTADNIIQCGETASVDPVNVTMPFADENYLERYEGMLVRFPQELVIAEYFNYDRYGEIVLSLPLEGESRPFTGTAIDEPGDDANARALANSMRRITLDDNNSSENPAVLRHPNGQPFSLTNRFRGGDIVTNTVGVLGYDFNKFRIFPIGPAEYESTNPRPEAPEAVGGDIRVAAMNALNFFVTADYPSGSQDNACGPDNDMECRGWDSDQPTEFTRQRTKLLEALEGLDADVIGLNEIENSTGVEPLESIVDGLPGYDYIETGTIGTDAIKVGLIYRTAAVTPVGDYQTLDSDDDPRFLDNRNRPALAQTFEVNSSGEKFTVVVNHLKSKGSECSGDPDTGDGQGNCSQTRADAAAALVDWLATDPTGSGDPDFLIMGDLNSYTMEDTIGAILAGPDDTIDTGDDYTNLIAKYQGQFAYSYTFDGQAGYLDHALASPSMVTQVTGATQWHINSDEPDVLDYDTSFKSAEQDALYEPNQFRTSDHDPVIVGLNLGATPVNAPPVIQPIDPVTVLVGHDLTLTIDASDPDNDPLTYKWIVTAPGGVTITIPEQTLAGRFTLPGTYNITMEVSDGTHTVTKDMILIVKLGLWLPLISK